MLAKLGFEALATTSAGYASPPACRTTASAATGCSRTSPRSLRRRTPVSAISRTGSATTEDRRGNHPARGCTGLAGGSIEDSIDRPGEKVYDIGLAADRIRAAVAAKGTVPFTLTARAENYLVGIPDLKDTIKRLQAYQEAGADVLYAPCITTREEITAIVSSVDRPVNFPDGHAAAALHAG
jgi:2-methylisocitrate lyase-like PEP mutase family enzyme